MVSVVSESTVQENIEEHKRTRKKTSTVDNISTFNPTPTISSDYSRAKKQPLCKYAANKQTCPYGEQCRYRHPPLHHPRKPICRHYLQGNCRYGNQCKFYHPQLTNESSSNEPPSFKDDQSSVLNVNEFPSISQSKTSVQYRHDTRTQPKTTTTRSTPPLERGRVLHQHDGSQTAPVELQLEAFFKRAAKITPKPAVSRPGGSANKNPQENKQEGSRIVDKVAQMEDTELKLLQREHCEVSEHKEREVHVLPFQPSDPQWYQDYGNHPLQLIVTFPENYPYEPLHLNIIDDETLPKSAILAINTKLDKQVAVMHQEAIVPTGHVPIFRNLLNWLDRNIVDINNDKECFSESSESEAETSEEGEGQEWEGSGDENLNSEYLRPTKRGTEIRMMELSLSKNVATLQLTRLKITVQCTRCKNKEDVICSPEKQTSQACEKCQACYAITVHPDIVHPTNPSLCFLDIIGCKPVDVVLPFCDFVVACLECQKEGGVKGLSYGEQWQTSCRGCHCRLQVFTESCKFIAHQSGPLDAMAKDLKAPAKKRRAKDGFIIQEGQPLPELGTCDHYKKSHRWLRFPCCGKAYPCDVCHDQTEDHPMERANRMICGYCSKEQGYTGIKPCVLCGSDLAHSKGSAYWEGGKGCRNKTKMKRTDPHKYKHENKTVSKKEERVGAKGKTNRSKNQPSV